MWYNISVTNKGLQKKYFYKELLYYDKEQNDRKGNLRTCRCKRRGIR